MQQHPVIWVEELRSQMSEGEMFETPSVGPESPTVGSSRPQPCVYFQRLTTRLPVALGEERSRRLHLQQRRTVPAGAAEFLARRDKFVSFPVVGVGDGKLLFYF